jgi:hypothetical protein
VEAEFSGPLPGLPASTCSIGGSSSGDDAGTKRYVRIAPPKTPGIQAPLAWTLSKIAQRELDRQRRKALNTPLARGLKAVAQTGQITCT